MNIKEEIRIFINEVSRRTGMCDIMHELDYLISKDYYEVDSFTREIFYIETINPETNLHLFRQVKKMFVDRFGCSEVYNLKEDEQ